MTRDSVNILGVLYKHIESGIVLTAESRHIVSAIRNVRSPSGMGILRESGDKDCLYRLIGHDLSDRP